MKVSKYSYLTLFVLAPLLLGASIYILGRVNSIYFLKYLPVSILIEDSEKLDFHPIILYNLPDGLWAFAIISSVFFIWKNDKRTHLIVWLAISISLMLLLEIYYGTFDIFDVTAIFLGTFVSIWLSLKINIQ